jgi:hypothetical protein
MNATRNHRDSELILTTDGQYITLILSDGTESDSVALDLDVWNAIVPIALAEDPIRLAEFVSLDFGPGELDAMGFEVDGHVLSLFWLAVIAGCCDHSPTVASIADGWTRIPLHDRVKWWHQASSDKPLHAQLLALNGSMSLVFEDKVPAWLPRLIDAGTSNPFSVLLNPGLHWTYARSPLGRSCIAFLDDESDNHEACLAISNCAVSCGAADGSMRGAALDAIDQLIAFRDEIEADCTIARRVCWEVSGHELIAMAATLQEWRERLPCPDRT